MDSNHLTEVYRAKNSPEAHVLKAALEEAGINAVIEGDLLQGALGEVPLGWSSSPRVLVERDDLPQAREIIRQSQTIKTSSRPSDQSEVCLACGNTLDADEETCPNCGWSYQEDPKN